MKIGSSYQHFGNLSSLLFGDAAILNNAFSNLKIQHESFICGNLVSFLYVAECSQKGDPNCCLKWLFWQLLWVTHNDSDEAAL
jgi:hypothetical protein